MANYLTQQDVQDYGTDLISVTQRAALEVVAPHIQNLEAQNYELQRRLAVEARRNLDQRVEKAVPDFRTIDEDPRWHQWLRGTDALSGRARQTLLDDAISSGDATRIANFFRKFRAEADGAQSASTRSGQTPARSEATIGQHVYSTAEIGRLYEKRRKGQFDEATWNRIESDIFSAQKQGRVQMHPYQTK